MKLVKKTEHYLCILLIAGLLIGSCQKEDVLDPDPIPNNPTTNVDANKVTQSLKFRNGKIISGEIPKIASLKSGKVVADLKIDIDTIFWVEGVINRIKILKPESLTGLVSTFWAQVEGSDSYIEAEFETEQENDTIVFLNFDFDITEWEPPFSFNINFVPADDTGLAPIDDFKLPVVIEEPIQNSNNGGEDYWQGYWHWMETSVGGVHHTGPYENIKQYATAGLCCDGLGGIWNCLSGDPSYQEMGFTIDYFVNREILYFSEISDVRGILRETSNNLDWENSNICENEPAYKNRIVHNPYRGTFTEIDSNTRTISDLKGREEEIFVENVSLGFVPLPIYASGGPYKLLSKHYIKEVRNNLDGPGAGVERLYYKRFVDPNLEYVETIYTKWFDMCGACAGN